jgi:hypothetical protein
MAANDSGLYKVTRSERRLLDQGFEGKGVKIKPVPDMPMGTFLDDVDDEKRIQKNKHPFSEACQSKTVHICGDIPDPESLGLLFEWPELFEQQKRKHESTTPSNIGLVTAGFITHRNLRPAIYSEPLRSNAPLVAFCMVDDMEMLISAVTTMAMEDSRAAELPVMVLQNSRPEDMVEPLIIDRSPQLRHFKKREEIFPHKIQKKCLIRTSKQLLRRR